MKITQEHHQALGKQMKKSGKNNRAEPTELNWIDKFPGCAELFQNVGWLDFFKKFDAAITPMSLINFPNAITKTW